MRIHQIEVNKSFTLWRWSWRSDRSEKISKRHGRDSRDGNWNLWLQELHSFEFSLRGCYSHVWRSSASSFRCLRRRETWKSDSMNMHESRRQLQIMLKKKTTKEKDSQQGQSTEEAKSTVLVFCEGVHVVPVWTSLGLLLTSLVVFCWLKHLLHLLSLPAFLGFTPFLMDNAFQNFGHWKFFWRVFFFFFLIYVLLDKRMDLELENLNRNRTAPHLWEEFCSACSVFFFCPRNFFTSVFICAILVTSTVSASFIQRKPCKRPGWACQHRVKEQKKKEGVDFQK